METADRFRNDFVARLSPEERESFMRLAVRQEAARGRLVYRVNDPAEYVYLLESGRMKIYRLSTGGREVLLWFCLPGEIFGLAEVCHGGERQNCVQACEDSRLLAVRRDDFQCFLERYPGASHLVSDVLARRLRNLGGILQSLAASDVNERVAQLLARLVEDYGRRAPDGDVCLDIPITHQEMANMIGTTRQSVTSALGELRQLGALSTENRRLCVRAARDLRTIRCAGP